MNEYTAAEKGVKGALRKFLRRVGDKEPMLSPWVDIIPTDHYMSIFNGGLKLIFAVSLSTHNLGKKDSLIKKNRRRQDERLRNADRSSRLCRICPRPWSGPASYKKSIVPTRDLQS